MAAVHIRNESFANKHFKRFSKYIKPNNSWNQLHQIILLLVFHTISLVFSVRF